MRLKLSIVAVVVVGLLAVDANEWTEGPSFREQLAELVEQRKTGEITEMEYRSKKAIVFSLMQH